MKKYLFLIISFFTALVASGATYYVVPGGAGSKNGTSWANAYADVQTAIDSASSSGGGEVWIKKGTYKHGSAMTMKNNVHIYGGFAGTETSKDQRVSGNNTILDGEGKYRVFYNNYTYSNPLTNSSKLDNVTIQNGYAGDGAGMYNYYASPEITNCTFSNNSSYSYGGGMYNRVSSSPVLTNCTFSNNSSSNCGGGMYNEYSSSPSLTNCTFSNNRASSRGGGMYNSSSSPVLTNCILWRNTASSSGNEIYNSNSNCKPTIDTCIIEGGKSGIYNSSYGTYTNIITSDPKLMPLGNYGGSVQTCPVGAGSSAIGKGKKMSGLTTDARGFARFTTAPTIGTCEYQNKLTISTITTTEGYLKYSSSYEFTLNVYVSDIGGTFTYQWYKDGESIEVATSSSYKTKQDAGTSKYTVVVSDGSTTITSSEIVIETINPVIYVSTTGSSSNDGLSWATAKSDVQEAVDLASEYYGSEVWIAKGTYKHGSAMTMKNSVAIYGGFAGTEISKDQRVAGNNTILDGEGKYRVFYNDYTDSNPLTNSAKLDNVTIQNGYSSGSSPDSNGGGMYNYYASPEITNCTFSNNSASGSPYGYGGGMYNDYSSPVLTNCTFSNNSASGSPYGYGGGMYNSSSNPELTNCTFTNNSASYGGGMYNGYYSSPSLTNCILWGNAASSSGNEIYNYNSYCTPTIDTCIIKGGYSDYGTYTNIITADPKLMPLGNYGGSVQTCPVGAGSSAIDVGKVVYGVTTDARGFTRFSSSPTIGACEYSILECDPSNPPFVKTEECIVKYSSSYEFTLNMFVTGNNLTYQWYKDGEAIEGATSSSYKTKQDAGTSKYTVVVSDGNTTITSSEIVIETVNPVIYVSTEGSSSNDGLSWATAKSDLQEAIDLASEYYGSEVWIAKGTYKHGSAMTMKNGVAIYGGFAGTETSKDQRVAGNNTILDGEGKYRVFYNDYTDSNPLTNSAKLDNVTIQNGYSSGSSPDSNGGGMFNYNASPEITNCTFSNNSASGSSYGCGGGIYNDSSSPKLTNCTFSGNRASGSSYGYGGGIYNDSSNPELTNCTFTNNSASYGGGMYNDYSSPVLANCTFLNNSASYGGGMYNSSSSPVLTNCTFTNNSASSGGGMDNLSSSPVLTNCTFSNNSASYGGGGMYNSSSSPVLTNCILWRNTASSSGNEIYNDSGNNPTIDTCIIKGGYSSYGAYTNIITADPKLMPLGNYGGSVQTCPVGAGSSAIGAGKVVDDVTTDARGFIRSVPYTIGAWQYCPTEITSQPLDTIIWANTDAILTVSIEGDNPTYQWQYSTNGSTWYDIEGETSSTLTLSNVPSSQNGYKYRCVVDSDKTDLTYSSVAILTVKQSPTLDNNPTGFEVWSNVDRSLSVSATGEEITYQWYFNGKAIEGATDSTLSFENMQTSASGSYYCVIKNPAGSVQSSSATVIVRQSVDSTTITKPLVDVITASNNGYACFETASSAYGTLSYTWYYKLNTSSYWNKLSETSNKLTIANETSHRNAQIKCVISNAGGSAETIANLTYTNDAIVFATQPESAHQYLYGSASFVVEATTSTEEITYQWQKLSNGDWVDINGATNSTYTDSYIQSSDLTSYRCKIGNGANAFAYSNTATLDNNIVISQQQIASQTLWENHKFELSVESQCNNIGYQWQYSSDNIEWANIENATSNSFSIEAVKPSDAGYYRCVISGNNWISTTSRVSQLAVKPIGSFTENPTGFEVWSDTNQSLSVSATGEELTYQWYFNGEAIEGATESTLSFDNIQFDKTGSYYCVITNPAGSVQSSTANVVVRQSATEDSITKKLEKVTTISGTGYARFVVETTAYNPTYKWYYGSGDTWTEFEETSNILFIPAESKYNRKNIKCEISNGGGSVSTQAVLVYSSTAIQITSQPQDVSFKLNENASFNVTVSTSTGNAYYQWQYSADSNEWQNIENATEATYSFKMMDSKNRGYYRCEIDNGGGILYSENAKIIFPEDVAITTQPTAITSAIIGAKATFTVVVSGDYPKYQWQVSYDYGDTWENIAGATNGTLGVDVVENIVDNSYRCLVWNDNNVDAPLESEMVWIENVIEPTAFQEWSMANGLGVDASPSATPHNDGITNLEKFTFGLDASKATSYGANASFKHTSDATGASLQFPVSVDAEGVVNVKALKSVDLINWTETTVTATGETSSDGKFKIYKATAPVGEEGKVFLKLKVEEK